MNDLVKIYERITFSDAAGADLKRENANIDGDTAMGTMLKYGSEGSKYFLLHNVLPETIAHAHTNGHIHIHDLDFYMLTETCCQIDLLPLFKRGFTTGHGYLREPQSIESYAALACIAIQSNQNEMHGGQSVPNFDFCMADGVRKTWKKEYDKAYNTCKDLLDPFDEGKAAAYATECADKYTDKRCYQAMEALIHNLNTMHSRAGAQVPFSSLNYGTDTSPEGRMVIRNLLLATEAGLGNGETSIFPVQIFKVKEDVNYNPGDPNYDLFQLAMRVSAKRLFPNFSFLDAPFNKQYYKSGDYNSEVAYMGCVAPESVVTYKIFGLVYVESIERMFHRVSLIIGIKLRRQGNAEYYDVSWTDVSIYDSHTQSFTKVKTVLRNKNVHDWKKVTIENGRVLIATADHPLPVEGKGRTTVAQLQPGDLIPTIQYQPVSNGLRHYDHGYMWLLGTILCDGSITGDTVSLYFGCDEEDIADYCKEVVASGCVPGSYKTANVYTERRGEHGNYIVVSIGGKKCAEALQEVLGGGIKNNRHIPPYVFRCDFDTRMAFMAGMIDADGYVHRKASSKGYGACIQIGSVNKELALQQMALAQSLRLPAKLYENHYDATDKSKIRYSVSFGASYELLKALKCGKKKKLLDLTSYPQHPVVPPVSRVIEVTDYDIYNSSGVMSYDVETESDRFDVNGINSHNCRTRVMGNVHDPKREVTCGRGNLSFTTINLPRIGIRAKGDKQKFMNLLREMEDLVRNQLLVRLEVQSKKKVYNYPFLMGNGIWLDSFNLKWDDTIGEVLKHGTLTMGFIGLAECLVAMFGKHHGESEEAQEFGLEIIKELRWYCDRCSEHYKLNFTLIATPAEGLAGRFVKLDREIYGTIKGITDRDYYTNSFHVPVYYPIKIHKKIDIEAPYHAFTNAGHITYVELDGDTAKNPKAFEKIIRYMHDKGIGYGSINHPVDRDPVCGYTGIIGDTCPRCGRHNGEGVPIELLQELSKKYRNVPKYYGGSDVSER